MSNNLNDTLDSILRKYYHPNTPPNEKEVCLNVFKRKCASNNINADTYKQRFEDREINKKQSESKRPNYDGKRASNSYYDYGFSGFDDMDEFFRNFFYGQWNSGNNQKHQTGPEPGSFEYESKNSWVKNFGDIKDCIYDIRKDHIRIQALYKVGDRWAIENFIFYCGGDPKQVIKELKKYDMFKFVSNGKRYSNYLNVNRIWGIDLNMKEHPIY